MDEKSTWTTKEVKTRLGTSEQRATKILQNIGYTLQGNKWRLGQTKTALRRREKWLEMEKRNKDRKNQ